MFMPNSHIQKPEAIEDDMEGTFPGSMTLTASAGSVLVAHSAWWYVVCNWKQALCLSPFLAEKVVY